MQREHALDDPEAQDGEEDGGGREPEAGRPEGVAVARESACPAAPSSNATGIAADAASVAYARNGPAMPSIAPSAGPISPPAEYAAKIRLMHTYSSPGQRLSVSNVMPIQRPPDPAPMSSRAAKYPSMPSMTTKPSDPITTSARPARITRCGETRTTAAPAATKPASMPSGNIATSAPVPAGEAEVAAAISGTTGAMTL